MLRTIILAAIIGVLVYVPTAMAQQSLFVTPSRVELDRTSKVQVVNLTNLSDITRAYKISIQDLIMTEEGITAPVDTFEYSAKRLIRYFPREFTLEPGQRQAIRVMFRPKPDLETGAYHTHLRFLEDITKRNELNNRGQSEAVIEAPLAYETLIPVTISNGETSVAHSIDAAKATYNPQTNKVDVALTIGKQGNGQALSFIETEYISANGTATPADVRRSVVLYREIDKRSRNYQFDFTQASAENMKLRISLFDTKDKGARPVQQVEVNLDK